jgi:hypothetical protein
VYDQARNTVITIKAATISTVPTMEKAKNLRSTTSTAISAIIATIDRRLPQAITSITQCQAVSSLRNTLPLYQVQP